MLRNIWILLAFLALPAYGDGECRQDRDTALRSLKDRRIDPDARAISGACLFKLHADHPQVAQALISIIRDASDDLLLREDLIAAFSEMPLRKRVKLEGNIVPSMGKEEKAAVERTVASAGGLLAVTQAVKAMEEIVPSSRFEADFIRAIADVALDESNHVIFRSVAVEALERVSRTAVDSGVYDAKSLKLAHDVLRSIALLDADGFFSGAKEAYARVERDNVFAAVLNRGQNRAISSVPGR